MPTPDHPRTIADRYRVVREVGRGGMGSVWLAVDERLGREVAIKGVGRLPGHSLTDQARALREARSSAALNHPHVVSVYDAVAEDDHVWLVMEYVEGRTLAQLIRDEGPLDPVRVARIGAQVADGLAAAHERGTIHRDVKPGNILLSRNDFAKISDFGIARTLGEETLTETGMLTGTPTYFAPELARGEDPSPASDVWALGASLYAAVEGKPPYPDQPNALALLATIADQRPPAPERAGVLTDPIGRMLDPDPRSRWSMADAAHALKQRSDAPPADPTRVSTREGSDALPVPPVAADPTPTPAPDPTPVAAPDAPPAQERRRRGAGVLVAGLLALLLIGLGALYLVTRDTDQEPAADRPSEQPSRTQDTDEPEPDPTETVTETASSSPEPSETAPAEPAGSGGSQVEFVEDYYSVLPEDTDTGWALLTPEYQEETGRDSYEGFWDGVDSVEVIDSRPAGDGAVDVELVYNGDDSETRRVVLEETDDGWLIADSYLV